jgi:hypothetical protein
MSARIDYRLVFATGRLVDNYIIATELVSASHKHR